MGPKQIPQILGSMQDEEAAIAVIQELGEDPILRGWAEDGLWKFPKKQRSLKRVRGVAKGYIGCWVRDCFSKKGDLVMGVLA